MSNLLADVRARYVEDDWCIAEAAVCHQELEAQRADHTVTYVSVLVQPAANLT